MTLKPKKLRLLRELEMKKLNEALAVLSAAFEAEQVKMMSSDTMMVCVTCGWTDGSFTVYWNDLPVYESPVGLDTAEQIVVRIMSRCGVQR